jgi:hypothetical protein
MGVAFASSVIPHVRLGQCEVGWNCKEYQHYALPLAGDGWIAEPEDSTNKDTAMVDVDDIGKISGAAPEAACSAVSGVVRLFRSQTSNRYFPSTLRKVLELIEG